MSLTRRVAHSVAARLAVWGIRLLWRTYRLEVRGHDRAAERFESRKPLVLTLWHDSVWVCGAYFRRLDRLGARVTYLVSPSIDGELGVKVLRLVGGRAVRGSATRSGVKAMRGMLRAITRENASPVILPDGPHGPRHVCKPGSLLLAQLSGAEILPMACAARHSLRLPTWDRALVPLPFTRVVIALGEPFDVASTLGEQALERERRRLEELLNELGGEAERAVK